MQAPEFSITKQAQIPAALAALHNFIIQNDILQLEDLEDDLQPGARPRDREGDPTEGDLVEAYPN